MEQILGCNFDFPDFDYCLDGCFGFELEVGQEAVDNCFDLVDDNCLGCFGFGWEQIDCCGFGFGSDCIDIDFGSG